MAGNNKVAVFFAFASVLLAQSALAISSDQAKSIASSYIEQNSGDQAALEPYNLQQPLDYNGKNYWMVFLKPQTAQSGDYSPTFIKFAVSDEDQSLVRDQEILAVLFMHNYKYHLEGTFLRNEKMSYADLQVSLEAIRLNLDNAKTNLDGLRASVAKRDHPAALDDKLAAIELQLGDLRDKAANLKDSNVRIGIDFESEFSQNSQVTSFDSAMGNYNTTFEALAGFLGAYDSYLPLVRDAQLAANLTSDEAQALQKISNLAPSIETFPFSSSLFEQAVADYNRQVSQDAPRAVNDSMSSTLYRIAKIDAQRAYERSRSPVESALADFASNARYYELCKTEEKANLLKSQWADTKAVMEGKKSASTEGYLQIPGNVSRAAGDAESIRQSMESCLSKPSVTPKPADYSGLSNAVAAIIVIGIGAYLYFRYKKSQADVDLES
ncbi:MAG: hypothetical protein WC792_01995 [Candidatus Micrarchaeia archaeon]|jgi:hypothetical protein